MLNISLPSLKPLTALLLAATAWGLSTQPAQAYPSCIVFAPNGEVLAPTAGNAYIYNALYNGNPNVWMGVNIGVLPSFPYGQSGLSFGGLEVGFDVLTQNGIVPAIKPILNVKSQLLVEADLWPSFAIGTMSLAPLHPAQSLNFPYMAATKTLAWGDIPLGRASLGLGRALNPDPAIFTGTAPFANSPYSLMGGYELPPIGPLSFAFDTIGGTSEVSNTNVIMNWALTDATYASLGYTLSLDRSAPQDTVFLELNANFGGLAP